MRLVPANVPDAAALEYAQYLHRQMRPWFLWVYLDPAARTGWVSVATEAICNGAEPPGWVQAPKPGGLNAGPVYTLVREAPRNPEPTTLEEAARYTDTKFDLFRGELSGVAQGLRAIRIEMRLLALLLEKGRPS